MRLLLDTHALLWALAEPHRLSPRAAALIKSPTNDVMVSAASAWEIATKFRLGRLPGAAPIVAGFAAHLATLRGSFSSRSPKLDGSDRSSNCASSLLS